MNTQKIADRMRAYMKLNNHQPDIAALQRSIEHEFPTITPEQFDRAIDVAVADLRAEAEMDREESLHLDAPRQLFDGLPSGTKLAEAARIKAAQGVPCGIRLHRFLTSRTYRLSTALVEAAMERHPDFERSDKLHVWQYLGDGDGPSETALTEWFQMTYPTEARAIEDAVV